MQIATPKRKAQAVSIPQSSRKRKAEEQESPIQDAQATRNQEPTTCLTNARLSAWLLHENSSLTTTSSDVKNSAILNFCYPLTKVEI